MLEQETRQQIRDMLERFVAEELIPAEAEMAANKAVPDHLITKMADMGLFGLSVPSEWGGLGMTLEEEVEVLVAKKSSRSRQPLKAI